MADESPHPCDPDEVIDHRVHGLRDGLDGVRDLMDRLLGENGCPWDRDQSLASLRPYLLEEAHEVLEALDHDDPDEHRRELGDLLFQIVFHAALREREQQFDLDGVIEAIRSKMLRRHPHVFGPDGADPQMTPAQVEANWAQIKAAERAATAARAKSKSGASTDPHIPTPLAGVPASLPAIQRAWRLQNKAAAVGFDWPDVAGPLRKSHEEFDELEAAIQAGDPAAIEEEFGDLLFVLVRLGTKLGIEAEAALRGTNRKFERRFGHVIQRCHAQGIDPTTAGLEILDGFWDEAKAIERGLDDPG
ncbi:Nucleoside triphosphate pyrophosphohydrolase MazG [Enhygromyxa salina]|uniref:Nucleoside triphosphate pyrophosphohydrolase MazG n=1 Tax=Enhygromyxa salina TaxID=215803 RepID=A0A0C2D3W7_9BACT|nr:nucleoside triphosphate pyrophosphohydrolase [Enhygromyxa salina]KIG14797.1 Nucleoside triphosphate pyrophosphohydrolase MazG [Enhygromyxa salina]